jgi:ABC-2 type transport system permease protein
MSVARTYAAAGAAIVARDLRVFVSYRMRTLSELLSLVLSLTLFYYLSRLVAGGYFDKPGAYFAYAVVGILILQTLTATLSILPVTLRQELVAGTFERLVVSPFGAVGSVASMLIFPFLSAIVMGGLMLVLAATAFGLDVQWGTALLAIPIALLGAAAFAPFALLIAGSVILVKQAGVGAGFVVTGISLVGGLLFPPELLPGSIRWMADVQPFTPAAELLRSVLVDTPLKGAAIADVAKMAGFAVILTPLSVLGLSSAIRLARRRGTIIEY